MMQPFRPVNGHAPSVPILGQPKRTWTCENGHVSEGPEPPRIFALISPTQMAMSSEPGCGVCFIAWAAGMFWVAEVLPKEGNDA